MRRVRCFLVGVALSIAGLGVVHAVWPLGLVIGLVATSFLGIGSYCEVAGCMRPIVAGDMAAFIGQPMLRATLVDANGNAVSVPLGERAENRAAAPSAPATAGSPVTSTVYPYLGVDYPDLAGACGAAGAYQQATNPSAGYSKTGVVVGGSCFLRVTNLANGGFADYWLSVRARVTTTTCASGYAVSGSSCVLSEPRQVVDDKRCDMLMSTGGFAFANDLNCSAMVDGSKVQTMIRDGKVVAYGLNSSGHPLVFTITPTASQVIISQQEQVAGANQTEVKTTTLTLDRVSSVLQSVSGGSAPGSVAGPSGGGSIPAGQPSGGTSGVNTPTVSTTSGSPDVKFPDDYARQSTLTGMAADVKKVADRFGDAEGSDPALPSGSDFSEAFFKDTFNALKGWALPSHSSQCPTGSFSWNNATYSIDAHCQLVTDHFGVLAAAMSVGWAVLALFIVLKA